MFHPFQLDAFIEMKLAASPITEEEMTAAAAETIVDVCCCCSSMLLSSKLVAACSIIAENADPSCIDCNISRMINKKSVPKRSPMAVRIGIAQVSGSRFMSHRR